jgi:hypothetical protein
VTTQPPTNGNGVYKTLFVAVATALITFASTWMLVARDKVTIDDFKTLQGEVHQLEIQVTRLADELEMRAKRQ